jgi:hypothetical protein
MQRHSYLSSTVLHRGVLRVDPKTSLLQYPEERRGGVAPRVGEDGFAFWGEQFGNQVRQRHGVWALVEHVGAEDEVKGRWMRYVRSAPVEEDGLGFLAEIRAGVIGREVEGGRVVVRREYSGTAGEGCDGGQPDPAPELDDTSADQVSFMEVTRQGDRARP